MIRLAYPWFLCLLLFLFLFSYGGKEVEEGSAFQVLISKVNEFEGKEEPEVDSSDSPFCGDYLFSKALARPQSGRAICQNKFGGSGYPPCSRYFRKYERSRF